jgi:Flp pilus assembly protein TadG
MMRLSKLLADVSGVVSVETALIMSLILLPMLLGLADLAQLAQGKAKVDEALQDALTYISAGNSGNSAGITTAAQAAYGSGISVATSTVCYCVSETTTTQPTMPTTVACTGSCSSSVLLKFMTVTVSNSINILFPISYMNLSSPRTVSVTGMIRTG